MIIYTCPKCGADLMFYQIDTYPPIDVASCTRCGLEHKKTQEIERVPYTIDEAAVNTVVKSGEV